MKSNVFLKEKLKELYSKFKEIKIRYEYCKSTYSHIIEVTPLSIFNNNEEYMRAEEALENKFENLYPKENIVFISDGFLTEIRDTDLTLGYETITFDNEGGSTEFIVEDFINGIEFHENNYALAA